MSKWTLLIITLVIIVAGDILTKQWALETLRFGETLHWLGLLPLTLTFNEGGGFSLSFGLHSRWIFLAVGSVILIGLLIFYWRADSRHWLRRLALAMIMAGAIGNLIDRLRWDQGVVDFIGPIDLGFMLWPIFNLADTAVSLGGVLLLLSLWRRDKPVEAAEPPQAPEPSQSSQLFLMI